MTKSNPTKQQAAEDAAIARSLGQDTTEAEAAAGITLPTGEALVGTVVATGGANVPAVRGPASDRATDLDLSEAGAAAMAHLNSWLESNKSHTANPDAAVADIIAQIMSADSVDEVLADVSATGLLELIDIPIRIHGGKFNQSDFEAGAPWYALMDVERLDNGWRGLVTTGAQSVLGQIVRIAQLGGFPAAVKCVYATKNPTANGYRPIRLGKI